MHHFHLTSNLRVRAHTLHNLPSNISQIHLPSQIYFTLIYEKKLYRMKTNNLVGTFICCKNWRKEKRKKIVDFHSNHIVELMSSVNIDREASPHNSFHVHINFSSRTYLLPIVTQTTAKQKLSSYFAR